jgi:hypothetical protein
MLRFFNSWCGGSPSSDAAALESDAATLAQLRRSPSASIVAASTGAPTEGMAALARSTAIEIDSSMADLPGMREIDSSGPDPPDLPADGLHAVAALASLSGTPLRLVQPTQLNADHGKAGHHLRCIDFADALEDDSDRRSQDNATPTLVADLDFDDEDASSCGSSDSGSDLD